MTGRDRLCMIYFYFSILSLFFLSLCNMNVWRLYKSRLQTEAQLVDIKTCRVWSAWISSDDVFGRAARTCTLLRSPTIYETYVKLKEAENTEPFICFFVSISICLPLPLSVPSLPLSLSLSPPVHHLHDALYPI